MNLGKGNKEKVICDEGETKESKCISMSSGTDEFGSLQICLLETKPHKIILRFSVPSA